MADLTHTAGQQIARPGLFVRLWRFWLPAPASVAPATDKPQSRAGKWPDPTNVLAFYISVRPVDSAEPLERHKGATLRELNAGSGENAGTTKGR